MENNKEILKIKGYIEENYNLDVEDIEKLKIVIKLLQRMRDIV